MSESVRNYRNRINESIAYIQPFFYECANEYNSSVQPASLKSYNNFDYLFFFKYFMQEMFGIIQIDGFPKEWNYEFFLWNLLFRGWLGVVNSESYGGFIPQPCVWGAGRNVFQFPTSVIVQNGWFNPEDGKTEFSLFPDLDTGTTESVVIHCTPDYAPLADIASQWALRAAALFPTIDNSAILSRNGYILQGDSKAESFTLEKAVQGILNGDLIVSMKSRRNKTPNDTVKLADIFESDVRKHYIVTDVLEDLQTIIDCYHSAIGFPTINRSKKERTIKLEQASLNAPKSVKPDLWERTLNESFERLNKIAGYSIKARFVYPMEEEIETGGGGDVSKDSANINN